MADYRPAPAIVPDRRTGAGTGRPTELYGIQMLRGLAAGAVVAHHVAEVASQDGTLNLPNWLVTAGASGVDIFFVISGCIMVHSSFREGKPPVDPGKFLTRRALRIYPIYWACALALLAMLSLRHAVAPSPSSLLPALLLLPSDMPIIPYSWTLSYELWFYLTFAVALCSRSMRATIAIAVMLMAGIGVIGGALASGPWARFLADPVSVEFVFGMGLILAYRYGRQSGRRWPFQPILILPAYAAIAAAPAFLSHTGTVGLPGWPRVLAWGVPSAVIVAASLAIGEPRGVLARAAAVFGNASYAVYLSHFMVMIGYRFILNNLDLAPLPAGSLMVVMFLAASGFGLLVHFYVEVPLMAFSRRVGSRELTIWRRVRS